jgi:predicted dehydrogenase
MAEAAKLVQSGRIGEVRFVRVWNFMNSPGPAPVPDSDPPADLNWDAWLGPAPKVPFNRNRLNFRQFMDYNNGFISDYGNHRFDTVHQVMGAEIPLRVSSSGMRLERQRAGDILDLQQATYEYPNFVMSYEGCLYNGHGLGGRTPGMRYYNARGEDDRPHGMAFYGTEAALFVDRIGMELYPEPGRGAGSGQRLERMHMNEPEPTPLHAKYFVDHVRNRTEPAANIDVGVRATAIACLGNVAFWTGRKLSWDDAQWQFPGDAEANRYLFRPYRDPWALVKIV